MATDFIADFMEATSGAMSPELFRKWAGIALLAAALERRVWIKTGDRLTFPNLYTFLVAPPGVGKQIIDDVRELVESIPTKPLYVSPDSMTRASLGDDLGKASRSMLVAGGQPITYHSMFIPAEEIGVMLPEYDKNFLGVLNRIYGNPKEHRETRRTGSVRELVIANPQLNILAGVQPGWMASVFPETAWTTGLTSRVIMIYVSEAEVRDIFAESPDTKDLKRRLTGRLASLTKVYGEMQWEPEAKEIMQGWHLGGGLPRPTHSKLDSYCNRRTQHAVKLALLSAVSRNQLTTIEVIDVKRAIAWLLEAEKLMPDIFRAMAGRSDATVLEELHLFMTRLWALHKQRPIDEKHLFNFLASQVPSEKIERLLEVAVRSNLIERFAGTTTYRPKAKLQYGME